MINQSNAGRFDPKVFVNCVQDLRLAQESRIIVIDKCSFPIMFLVVLSFFRGGYQTEGGLLSLQAYHVWGMALNT